MNSRRIEERFDSPEVKGEWEPCHRIDVRYMSDVEIIRWVRDANRKAKADMEYVRFRSVPDDSGDNW